ncbi:MAG: hypothetical protein ACK5Y6_02855 [Pseudomonadota bacterium]
MPTEQSLNILEITDPKLIGSPILRALWLDHHDRWEDAHNTVQDESDPLSAAVHAYLHRKEGDTWNANYWYRAAKRKPFAGSLDQEWQSLLQEECARHR